MLMDDSVSRSGSGQNDIAYRSRMFKFGQNIYDLFSQADRKWQRKKSNKALCAESLLRD